MNKNKTESRDVCSVIEPTMFIEPTMCKHDLIDEFGKEVCRFCGKVQE